MVRITERVIEASFVSRKFESRHARFVVSRIRSKHTRGRGDLRETCGFAQSRHARSARIGRDERTGTEFEPCKSQRRAKRGDRLAPVRIP